MNPINKWYKAVKEITALFDPNIKVEITGGVKVDVPPEVLYKCNNLISSVTPDTSQITRKVTMTLSLPCRKETWHTDHDDKPKTSEAYAAADFIRDNIERYGILSDDVSAEIDLKPPKRRKGRVWDYWQVELLFPCPPAVLPTPYREEITKHCMDYRTRIRILNSVFHCFHDSKYDFTEELVVNAQKFNWGGKIEFWKFKTAYYCCSFRNNNKQVVHCILRKPNTRRRTAYLLGRTLYATKSCLVRDIEETT